MENPIAVFERLYHAHPTATLGLGVAGAGAVAYLRLKHPTPKPNGQQGTQAAQIGMQPTYGSTSLGIGAGNGVLGWVGNGPATQGPPGPQGPAGPTGPPAPTPKPVPAPTPTPSKPPTTGKPYYCPAGSVMTKERGGTGNDVCQRPDGVQFQVVYYKSGQGGPYAGGPHYGSIQPYGGAGGFSPLAPMPSEHVVNEGDTLAGIGRRYWGNPSAGERYAGQVGDAGLIPGMRIRLY